MAKQSILFDARARVLMPRAETPGIQSIYAFNMYRSASSVTEAVCETLAACSRHTAFNVVRELNDAGVSLVDHADHSRSSVFIDQVSLSLDQLGSFGGFLYYGFREVPLNYASRFLFTKAALIVVRDPRDILISQYRAVQNHTLEGASGGDITKLRQAADDQSLAKFVSSEQSLAFIRRIVGCYRPLISRGVKVMRYEDFVRGRVFDLARFVVEMIEGFGPYIELDRPLSELMDNLDIRIKNSKALKGHATTGTTGLYRRLDSTVAEKLTSDLNSELLTLGYV